MNASNREALGAVVARQRGRARLRAATIAMGAASLVAAGAVAYTLPGTSHTTTTAGASATQGASTAVHTVSGGSGVSAAQTSTRSGAGSATAPTSTTGSSHVSSGGS